MTGGEFTSRHHFNQSSLDANEHTSNKVRQLNTADMVQVSTYYLPPTKLMPNSRFPLLHYQKVFSDNEPQTIISKFYDLLTTNKWQPQWIFRYSDAQRSHYHSFVHECMVVLTGSATIRFGVADTVTDMQENTYGSGKETGGIELEAAVGDVFVIPAGVAHKTYRAKPDAEFKLLTPGDGHSLLSREDLEKTAINGFTMMGAYDENGGPWDFAMGEENNEADFERTWAVPAAAWDPVFGGGNEGLYELWKQ